ncbi:MAG: CHAT domain-containing protein [Mesorhizobium sp.]|nr:CHAT domain-containing protein [Mesorhizobium sp.]MBL8580101.1 CHAT domain-containing protein [Mesorhizobium sp.]
MRTSWRFGLALSLAMAVATPATACPAFRDAVELAGLQYQDLLADRSVESPYSPNYDGTEGAIDAYLAIPSSPRETGERGLIFYVNDGQRLCGFFWASGSQRTVEFAVATPSSEIAALIERAVSAVAEGGAPLERRAIRRAEAREGEEAGLRSASSLVPPRRSEGEALQLLNEVSAQIFPEPVRGKLSTLSSLTIVPAINIGVLPFAALDPDGDGIPLVETTALNIEASLGDVLAGRIFAIGGGVEPQAIVGDPDASTDPEWIFPRLPGAEREARAVAERFGTVAVIGAEATVEEVVPKLRGAGYAHIAAHGYSSAADPIDGSFLALTGDRLTARAIQSMRFERPALVTLSACQTGLGGQMDVGIIGLSRGFLLAGASAVVASLWNVDDEATAQIMQAYVEALATDPPAEALRKAQSEARRKWKDPSRWAAFLMFGSRIVVLPPKSPQPEANTEIAYELIRGERPVEADLGAAVPVAEGDVLAGRIFNGGSEPADLLLLYVDAKGASSEVLRQRVQPGETVDESLLQFNEGTTGRERLITVLETVDPADIEGKSLAGMELLAPLARVVRLVGYPALPAFISEQGIVRLTDMTPAVLGGAVSTTQQREDIPSYRRSVQIMEFQVGE